MDNGWQSLSGKKTFDLNKLFNPEFLKLLEEKFEDMDINLIDMKIALIEKDNSDDERDIPNSVELIELKNTTVEDTLLDVLTVTASESATFEKSKEVIDDFIKTK